MWHLVAIIAGIIGLLHCLNPRKSQWQDKKQNKAGRAVPEAMMSNSNGIHVLDDYYTHFKLSHASHARKNLSETRTNKPEKRRVKKPNIEKVPRLQGGYISNSNAFDALELRNQTIMGDVMGALADPNTHLIGIYGSDDVVKNALLQKVYRRIQRDQLFGMVVTASVARYPDVRKIQDDIACQLGFSFNHKSKAKRVNELIRSIKNKRSILIVLCDLYHGLDLGKVGIPYGTDHTGCKILLTSITEDVLSNHMHTHINFMV